MSVSGCSLLSSRGNKSVSIQFREEYVFVSDAREKTCCFMVREINVCVSGSRGETVCVSCVP